MKSKILCISILAIIISGCGMQNVKNTREARLMPEEVARSVLVKYFGKDWVNNPTARAVHGGFCKDTYSFPISGIQQVQNVKWSNNIISLMNWTFPAGLNPYPCGSVAIYRVEQNAPFTDDDINDIVDALVSLGAKIKEVKRE
jgi:hypothetical protein